MSYFVYGEKINTYTTTDPIQQEFIEAGLNYIGYLGRITNAIPIYKIFPTKTYREYVKIVRRIQVVGEFMTFPFIHSFIRSILHSFNLSFVHSFIQLMVSKAKVMRSLVKHKVFYTRIHISKIT